MLIICPHCATSYRVELSALSPSGRSVRCVRCRTIWTTVAKPAPALEMVAVERHAHSFAGSEDFPASAPSPSDDAVARPDGFDALPGNQDRENSSSVTSELVVDAADADGAAITDTIISDTFTDDETGTHGVTDQGITDHDGENDPGISAAGEDQPEEQATDISTLRDAEPVAILGAPSIVPPAAYDDALPRPEKTIEDNGEDNGEDIESFAARRPQLRSNRWHQRWPRPPVLPLAIMALFTATAVLIGWRKDVVYFAPQTASFYAAVGLPVNLRGLVFKDIKGTKESHDGVPILVIEGMIASATSHPVEVPQLRFALRDNNGNEIYSWTAMPSRSVLGPGEQATFRSRLASPPADGKDMVVRFFNHRDTLAGIR